MIDRPGYVPKYAQLADDVLRQIQADNLGPGDRLATEIELAEQYGVSRPTVRRALAMLQRDGYITRRKKSGTVVRKPVRNVRSVRRGRGTIVAICWDERAAHPEEDFAFLNALRLTERALGARGFALQFMGLGSEQALGRERLEQLSVRPDLEGIISWGRCASAYAELLPDVPVVEVSTWRPGHLPGAGADVAGDCEAAIEHLLAHGHRQIAMICAPWLDGEAFAVFANGYRAAFAARGLPYERSLMCQAHPGESLSVFARQVLTGPIRPTAVLAENWRVCEAVLAATNELGWKIPDELSIVAYGENALRVQSPVPITAYVPDCQGEVEQAVKLLEALVDGNHVAEQHILCPGHLVERGSVRRLDNPHEQLGVD
jgi:DNA-binding LacI/PurR family transcriptional regulator